MSDMNGHGPKVAGPYSNQSIEVLPMAGPAQYDIKQVQMPDGTMAILFELYHMTGFVATFWPGDAAERLGQQLIERGKAASSGLLLPPQN